MSVLKSFIFVVFKTDIFESTNFEIFIHTYLFIRDFGKLNLNDGLILGLGKEY